MPFHLLINNFIFLCCLPNNVATKATNRMLLSTGRGMYEHALEYVCRYNAVGWQSQWRWLWRCQAATLWRHWCRINFPLFSPLSDVDDDDDVISFHLSGLLSELCGCLVFWLQASGGFTSFLGVFMPTSEFVARCCCNMQLIKKLNSNLFGNFCSSNMQLITWKCANYVVSGCVWRSALIVCPEFYRIMLTTQIHIAN